MWTNFRKLMLALAIVAGVTACGEGKKQYKVTWTVYYPGNTQTRTEEVWAYDCGYVNSSKGTNYLFIPGHGTVISSSAPIEYVRCIRISPK